MTGIRKGYFSCQEWYSIRVRGGWVGGGGGKGLDLEAELPPLNLC